MNNRHDDISHSNKWTRVPSDLSSVEPILCVPDLHIPMPSNFSFAIIIIFIWKRAPQLSNRMTPVESGTVVGIFAEGKTHALAVGVQCVCTVQHQNKIWLLTQLSCVNMPRDSFPDLLKHVPSGWQDKYVNNRDCSEKQRRWRWELPLPQWWPLEHETLQTVAVIASQSQTFFCEVFFFLQDVYQSCCQGGCPQLWRCAKAINSNDISETGPVSIYCGFINNLFNF